MREQENEAMVRYLEQLQKEDWEELKKRKQQQKKLAVRATGMRYRLIHW
jgi:hypothetical protein